VFFLGRSLSSTANQFCLDVVVSSVQHALAQGCTCNLILGSTKDVIPKLSSEHKMSPFRLFGFVISCSF
jgi:hypothetical protein